MIHKASDADMERLQELLINYIEESKVALTLDELLLSVNLILPTRDSEGTIQGFVAYDVVDTANYGKVVIWRILYTDPSVRENFKQIMEEVLTFFRSQGYHYIETQTNYKVNNFYERKLKSKPMQYIHFGRVDDYLRRLNK